MKSGAPRDERQEKGKFSSARLGQSFQFGSRHRPVATCAPDATFIYCKGADVAGFGGLICAYDLTSCVRAHAGELKPRKQMQA